MDDIFLLTLDDYKKYQQNIPLIRCWWWLQTPGIDVNSVMNIYNDGNINYNGLSVTDTYAAIRPVIITNGELNIGSRFIKYEFPWVVIGKYLAIAEVPIGFEKFDDKTTLYNESYIKQWIENWKTNRLI